MVSLSQIQEMPTKSMILLVGAPGAGKSTFCHQVVLNGIALDRSVIFVTTEHAPSEVITLLRERGMGKPHPNALSFVDAFGETVGAPNLERPDTVAANCEDLTSISLGIAKLQERINKQEILLAFDSLTFPYLFNENEMFKFVRLCLAKFASEGNSVLALMDEGCSKDEDLSAMMSVADGILRMEMKELSRTLSVVKHPRVEPARIYVPIEPRHPQSRPSMDVDWDELAKWGQKGEAALRREVGDFVNLFWPNLAHWSCMLWDPKGFPTMLYEMNKYESRSARDLLPFGPWTMRLKYRIMRSLQALGLFIPNNFSQIKHMKKVLKQQHFQMPEHGERSGVLEYLEDLSKTDEHYFRVYENCDCVGLENIGVPIASHIPPMIAGYCQLYEKDEREWNAVETKCIGLGDPYCEFKLVPGEIDELKGSLEKDSSLVEMIHERLMERLMRFLLDGKPLVERPKLGSDVHLHVVVHGMGLLNLAGERYRRAQMIGAARSAKKISERLIAAGYSKDEALKRIFNFLEHCKVGNISLGDTVRIRDNCECLRTTLFIHEKQPSCYFTTGFLNGLFSTIKNQHVREVRCIAAGDPYCEWQFT